MIDGSSYERESSLDRPLCKKLRLRRYAGEYKSVDSMKLIILGEEIFRKDIIFII